MTLKITSKTTALVWDECQMIEDYAQKFLQNGDAKTKKEVFDMACNDFDYISLQYEAFLKDFSVILKKISANGCYHIEGHNMGWRHLSGSMYLEALNAETFILRSFPKTSEWRFDGTYDTTKKILTYHLFHHDVPTGESYRVSKS